MPLACLRGEIREELGVDVRVAQPFGGVRAPAALEPRQMDMTVYLAELGGTPAPAAEIASLAWWSDGCGVRLAPRCATSSSRACAPPGCCDGQANGTTSCSQVAPSGGVTMPIR